MKKRFFITVLSLMVTCLLSAAPISFDKAKNIAKEFFAMQQKGKNPHNGQRMAPAEANTPVMAEAGVENLWVFNNGGNNGFVVIANEDTENPVLGYSEEGTYNYTRLPEELRLLLTDYSRQIRNRRMEGKHINVEPKDRDLIKPLITTHWHQYNPMNILCPTISGEPRRSLVGCCAVVLAQLMYYYHYPEKPTMAIPAYTTGTGYAMEELPVITFDYDKMVDYYYYQYEELEVIDESLKAATTLLKYCGCAVQMNYSCNGSASSFDTQAIAKYFGFDKGAKRMMAGNYSHDLWEDLIYNELKEGRPVPYSAGAVMQQNHIFLIDGYDGHGYFHANFGEIDGFSNGYFKLGVMNDCENQFGNVEFSGYNMYQSAVIGFQPDKGNPVANDDEYDIIENDPNMLVSKVHFYAPYVDEKLVTEIEYTNNGNNYENHLFLWIDDQLMGGAGVYTDPGQQGKAVICSRSLQKGNHPYRISTDWDGVKVVNQGTLQIVDHPENNLESTCTVDGVYIKGIIGKEGYRHVKDIYHHFSIHMKLTNKANTPFNQHIVCHVGRASMDQLRENIGSEELICNRVWYLYIEPNKTMDFDLTLDDAIWDDGEYGYSIYIGYCDHRDSTKLIWGNGYFKYFKTPSSNIRGDVNGDGIVNIADVTSTINKNYYPMTDGFFINNADLNDDIMIDKLDVDEMVKIIIGGK